MTKRARIRVGGFTIIEVLIVLAVTTGLIAAATTLFSGRLAQSRFSSELNEFDVTLRDQMNNVANGLSAGAGTGVCGAAAGAEVGTTEACISLGKAIQFGVRDATNCTSGGPGDECDELAIYDVYGDRLDGGDPVESLTEAEPRLIAVPGQQFTMGYGLHIDRATVLDPGGGPGTEISGIVFTQTFGQTSPVSGDLEGSPSVQLSALEGGGLGLAPADFASTFFSSNVSSWQQNPPAGIEICLESGTTNQFAVVSLGRNNRVITTNVEVLDETDWNSRCVS